MTYGESVEWLDSLSRFGINPGLERIDALCRELSNPQNDVKFIHVAGTNGKGSVSCMLSGVLTKSGYKTGLFTSPFTVSICEQLQINGEYITHNAFAALFTQVRGAAECLYEKNIVPTMFETLCAAAFLYFSKSSCDYAVIECGMGGRLDSTNIIPAPILCVFTSVSLDHTTFLGENTSLIAREKGGIMKPGSIAVCYPKISGTINFVPQDEKVAETLQSLAVQNGCEIYFADSKNVFLTASDMFSSDIDTQFGSVHIPFGGMHQTANTLTVLESIRQLRKQGVIIPDAAVRQGIASSSIPARFENLSDKPLVILDGGHNPGCAAAVADNLKKLSGGKRITVLAAMMKDKDFESSFSFILPLASNAVFTSPEISRAADAKKLAEKAQSYCKSIAYFENSRDALKAALKCTGEDDILLICGSFYLAQELRSSFLK